MRTRRLSGVLWRFLLVFAGSESDRAPGLTCVPCPRCGARVSARRGVPCVEGARPSLVYCSVCRALPRRRLRADRLWHPAPSLSGLCRASKARCVTALRAGTQQGLLTAPFPPVGEVRAERRDPLSRVSHNLQ